jgi:hypothetical protein
MANLAARMSTMVMDPDTDLWFPELTGELTEREWDRWSGDFGLTPNNYGTTRVLSRNISTPRHIVAYLTNLSSGGTQPIAIEALNERSAIQYHKQGVTFATSEEIQQTAILSCIEDALAVINQMPSLMRTVAKLVRSLHVIESEKEDHDVSFSEPSIPFSIFVSVPNKRITNDRLRVAEAIIHETMHLQLTLMERIQPLVTRSEKRYFSPWRQEPRNAQSLLHGIYVFRVIAEVLGDLNVSDDSELEYLSRRRSEIAAEINQTRFSPDCAELTSIGSAFIGRLLDAPL